MVKTTVNKLPFYIRTTERNPEVFFFLVPTVITDVKEFFVPLF